METASLGIVGALLVLVAGWLGGACGIGGVLMVPALAAFEGVDPHKAIAATSVAFATMGALAYLRFRHEGRPMVGGVTLMAATAPGAALGGLLVHAIPAGHLMTALALLLIGSGLHGLRRAARGEGAELARVPMACIGFVVGLGSALTGTGGAVLLMPILLTLRQPLQATIASSIVVQLPIGSFGVIGHLAARAVEFSLAAQLSVLLIAGAAAGRWCADRVSVGLLRHVVTFMLVGVGAWILLRQSGI
jgi:uncharacterized membrane protein YfcA